MDEGKAAVDTAGGDAGPHAGYADKPVDAAARAARYRTRFFRVWGYIGIAVITVFVCWLVGHISDAIAVLTFGAVVAFVYAPIGNWLNRRLGMPRLPATLIGLITLLALVVLFVGALIPPVVSQTAAFLQSLPAYMEQVRVVWGDVNAYLGNQDDAIVQAVLSFLSGISQQAGSMGESLASRAASGMFSGVVNLVTVVIDLALGLVISFWLAKDFPTIELELSTIVGPRRGEDYRIITTVFGRSLSGYLKGLLITSACTGVIAGVGFWLLGVPYSMLLGLGTAVLNIIPFVGPWIGGIIAFLVALSVSPLSALLSIVVTVAAQQFTDNFISPKVMQAAVSLHPVLVIFALTAGGCLGGVFGMILAVPLTAAAKGTFVYYFEKKTGRQLVNRNGKLFKGEQYVDENGAPRPACDALGIDITADEGVPERIRKALEAEQRAVGADEAGNGSDAGAPTP